MGGYLILISVILAANAAVLAAFEFRCGDGRWRLGGVAVSAPTRSAGSAGSTSPSTVAHVAAVAALWLAVGVLVRALVTEDLSLASVAEQTRPGTGWARRASGLWSGAEGSLLLFAAVVSTALLAGRHAAPRWQRVGTAIVTGGLAGASLFGANPFARLDPVPAAGRGMAPILEHGAMLIHPPLLYAGFALAVTPALVRDRARAHRLGLMAVAVLTAAQAIGASWAYVELGWGGWWAWDPIENVALVVWLLLVAALHTRVLDPDRQTGTGLLSAPVLWALCWPAVLAGAALTRTSQRTSVHAFADAIHLARWLWPLAALAAVGAVLRVAEDRPTVPLRSEWARRSPQVVLGLAALIVAAGTYRPFVSGDGTAGWFYSRALFPVALVGVVLAAVLPTRSARWNPAVVLAHGGMVLILVAAVGGTLATETTVRLDEGEIAEVDNRSVTLAALTVDEDDRPTVTAEVIVDSRHHLYPSVTLHPDSGLRLPEIATRSTPWLDTQVILRDVDPRLGAQLTVRFRPLNQLVWWGAALVALGAALAAAGAGGRRSGTRKPSPTVSQPLD